MFCQDPWTPLHFTFPSGTSQGWLAITPERTLRIILLASRVLVLCITRWLSIYEIAIEPDKSHTSASTYLDGIFQTRMFS